MGYVIKNTVNSKGFIPRRGEQVEKGEDPKVWPNKRSAEARCKKANTKAEELGIKARFEVEEVTA